MFQLSSTEGVEMFEVEKDRDEVVVTSESGFDVVHRDGVGTLVLTLREARKLSEALLDATLTVYLDLEPEDG
jgi:hypothetical protein